MTARSAGTNGNGDGAPEWLRRLAAAAAAMDVPEIARPPDSGGRSSAVLVLFGEGGSGPDLLYIQRNEGLRRHAGQPAFPGGRIEDTDDGPVAAALREAAEETGLDPAGVDVLAVMPEMFIPRSQFRVVPVVGWWREPSVVRPVDTGEVAGVERVSVADLADPANRVMIKYPGGRSGPAFRVGSMLIWGFTALITDRLLVLGEWERPWDTAETGELPAGYGRLWHAVYRPYRIPLTPCAVTSSISPSSSSLPRSPSRATGRDSSSAP